MRLCFGTFGTVLKLCKIKGISDYVLVGAIIKTIDPDSQYDNSDNKSTVSLLLNCKGNFSIGQINRGSGAVRKPGENLGQVVKLAPYANKNDMASKFEENVLKLIDEDKKECMVLALLDIIDKDETLDGSNREKFEKYLGTTKESLLKQDTFVLSDFFSGVFLYTVIIGDNKIGEKCVKEIDKDYIASLRNDRGIKISDTFPLEDILKTNDQLINNTEETVNFKNSIYLEQMVDIFEQSIIDFHIVDFIQDDPSAGLKANLLDSVEEFIEHIEKKVIKQYMHYKKESLYMKIKEFVIALKEYYKHVSEGLIGGGYSEYANVIMPVGKYPGWFSDFMDENKEHQLKINSIYSEICNGNTLFIY